MSALNKSDERSRGDAMATVLGWLMGIGMVAFVVVASAYGRTFGWSLGSKRDEWGQFGDFVGGSINPVLSFLSLFALLLTVMMQREQLADSRAQLKGAQAEAERSRELQVAMADAMDRQAHYATVSARVSALSAALSVASEQLSQAQQSTVPGTDNVARYEAMLGRKEALARQIIELTDELRAGETSISLHPDSRDSRDGSR